MKKPTLNSVADMAGTSRGTVSNFINGKKVKNETAVKIQEAIDQLGYVPNLQARELKTAQSNTVVLIVPNSWTNFFAELVFKMQSELYRKGFKMILANSHADSHEEKEILEMARLNQVAGVITMSYTDITNYIDLSKKLNLVAIEHFISEKVPLITSDNYMGGQLAAEKLIEFGAKKFLLLRRKVQRSNATDIRTKGFLDRLKSEGLLVDIFESSAKNETYRQEFISYLQTHTVDGKFMFDGIFGVTDEYAIIASEYFKAHADIEFNHSNIIGFDGSRSSEFEPLRVSSIRQNVEALVSESVKVLSDMISGTKIETGYERVIPVEYQSVDEEK